MLLLSIGFTCAIFCWNEFTFTSGTMMTVPASCDGSRSAITRSSAMIDAYSVPCAPETSARTGPGRAPCATTTGMLSAASDPAGISIVPETFSARPARAVPTTNASSPGPARAASKRAVAVMFMVLMYAFPANPHARARTNVDIRVFDERDDLRAKLTEMRLSRDVTAARAEAQSVKVTTLAAKAPPPAEDDDAQLAKRFTLVLERLTKQMEGAGQQQDASQANPQALAQLLTMAANRSQNGQQLNDYLNMIRPLTGGKEGNVFVILGGGVPAWDLPTLAPGSQAPPPAQVSAMEKIIDLSEDPLVTMKRFRELVTAAVQKFNDGSLAATVWMLDVAEDTITEKKLDPAGVDQIRAEAANAMSSMQLRKYTENKNKHGALKIVLEFFPTLRLD